MCQSLGHKCIRSYWEKYTIFSGNYAVGESKRSWKKTNFAEILRSWPESTVTAQRLTHFMYLQNSENVSIFWSKCLFLINYQINYLFSLTIWSYMSYYTLMAQRLTHFVYLQNSENVSIFGSKTSPIILRRQLRSWSFDATWFFCSIIASIGVTVLFNLTKSAFWYLPELS